MWDFLCRKTMYLWIFCAWKCAVPGCFHIQEIHLFPLTKNLGKLTMKQKVSSLFLGKFGSRITQFFIVSLSLRWQWKADKCGASFNYEGKNRRLFLCCFCCCYKSLHTQQHRTLELAQLLTRQKTFQIIGTFHPGEFYCNLITMEWP